MARNAIEIKQALDNYKRIHAERAKELGVYKAFMEARTLTAARRLVFP